MNSTITIGLYPVYCAKFQESQMDRKPQSH